MINISAIFHQASGEIKKEFYKALDYTKDIWAALHQKGAMSTEQRHLNEFKFVAGGSIAGVGLIEASPLVTAGGAIPAWESLQELEHAGHLWREHHRHHN